ncbi:MAG: ribonuclease HII [Pararhodobacter sp.]|nr:ribonuclease HII [Pararhodobacter sp.]
MSSPPSRHRRPAPDHELEAQLIAAGARCVAGVDEVGRGPLAGPVTAAAVVLDPARIPPGLDDSKNLSPRRREELAEAIRQSSRWAVAHASVAEIEALNILQASHLAMRRALAALAPPPDAALIDGNRLPRDLPCKAQTVVKGDARCLSIAAASILAKVERDALMVDLALECPGYGWEKNAGYPTRAHLAALRRLGVSPYHRRKFAPIRNMLCEEHEIRG